MNKITQTAQYRQSLMQYAEKYGVGRASRKYNRNRSFIYFWKKRRDGSVAPLACQSRRPHSHPDQHTEAELKLIRDMRRRGPTLGMIELWRRLRLRGHTRRPRSLFRVMRKIGMFLQKDSKKFYNMPKPYEQMTCPGQRVQINVKFVPKSCLVGQAAEEGRYYQYTFLDEYSRFRYLEAFQEHGTYSSAEFIRTV